MQKKWEAAQLLTIILARKRVYKVYKVNILSVNFELTFHRVSIKIIVKMLVQKCSLKILKIVQHSDK